MRLLVDTDAFCKLAASGLLHEAIALLGADIAECGRLPALPWMLRRGKLRAAFGAGVCDGLLVLADEMPECSVPDPSWLDRLTGVASIDPGEALLLARAAESGILLLTGDKRSLSAVRSVPAFVMALSGRIVVIEAVLIALCRQLGSEEVRRRVRTAMEADKVIQVCFSTETSDPEAALLPYLTSLSADVAPLTLWSPGSRSGS